jgi:hypothetical protein
MLCEGLVIVLMPSFVDKLWAKCKFLWEKSEAVSKSIRPEWILIIVLKFTLHTN